MIIKWNKDVIRKELVNPNLILFRDWIDKYAEACEDIPRTHNSFYETWMRLSNLENETFQLGKSEQTINAREICPLYSQSHNLGKCQKFLSENVSSRQCDNCTYALIVFLNIQKDNAAVITDTR